MEGADQFEVGHRVFGRSRLSVPGAAVVRAQRSRHERGPLAPGSRGLPLQGQRHLQRAPSRHLQIHSRSQGHQCLFMTISK